MQEEEYRPNSLSSRMESIDRVRQPLDRAAHETNSPEGNITQKAKELVNRAANMGGLASRLEALVERVDPSEGEIAMPAGCDGPDKPYFGHGIPGLLDEAIHRYADSMVRISSALERLDASL